MFTGKQNEKEVVMQLDIDENMLWDEELTKLGTTELPYSLLFCSDGSVIVGYGNVEIQEVRWYPCFEMVKFYSTKFDINNYIEFVPNINTISTMYLLPGPPE